MRIFSYIIIVLSIITIIFNTTKIDFEKPFEGESTIAIIGIIAEGGNSVIIATNKCQNNNQ